MDNEQNKIILLEEKYNQIITDVLNLKDRLSKLRDKEQFLPYSNHKVINVISCVIVFFTFFILIGLCSYLLFTNLSTVLVCSILMFGGIPVLGLIEVIVLKRVIKVIKQKSYDNIVNSLEYKQLLEDIKDVSKLLDEKMLRQTEIERELFDSRSKQAIMNAEKNIKFVLGNYNSEIEDVSLGSSSRIRGYSRKLVYNGRNCNRGNIE